MTKADDSLRSVTERHVFHLYSPLRKKNNLDESYIRWIWDSKRGWWRCKYRSEERKDLLRTRRMREHNRYAWTVRDRFAIIGHRETDFHMTTTKNTNSLDSHLIRAGWKAKNWTFCYKNGAKKKRSETIPAPLKMSKFKFSLPSEINTYALSPTHWAKLQFVNEKKNTIQ